MNFVAGKPAMDALRENLRRTQGKWSLEDRYAQFAAGPAGGWINVPTFYLQAVNDADERLLERLLDAGHKVLLDSGIFNLTNAHMRKTGCTMDYALGLAPDQIEGFDQLFERYVMFARRYGDRVWGYIELDQGGKENKRITRAKLQDLGLDPIPVYHPLNDGWEYFDELAEGYSRMCFGNIVQAPQSIRTRLLHTLWERHRQYPDLWVHVLGLTPSDQCLTFTPDSCDSSTWSSGMRYPAVYLGSAYLDRVSFISDPAFRYASGQTAVPMTEHYKDWRPMSPSYWAAVGCYADEVEFTSLVWKRIQADRARELGETPFPAYLDGEGELCPAQR